MFTSYMQILTFQIYNKLFDFLEMSILQFYDLRTKNIHVETKKKNKHLIITKRQTKHKIRAVNFQNGR